MSDCLDFVDILYYEHRRAVFVVVGAGGTGSYLIRDLSRLLGLTNRQYGRQDKILILEQDIVEDHNLSRQNFVLADVGKNKGEVLAARYSKAFGVEISVYPFYLNTEFNMSKLTSITSNSTSSQYILIGCVDNNKTRCLIHNLYKDLLNHGYPTVYLDSGNEEHAGQVVFSATQFKTMNGYSFGHRLPDVVDFFNMKPDDRHPSELSCAEHAIHAPQNIATNMLAAHILFNYCSSIINACGTIFPRNGQDYNLNQYQEAELCKSLRPIPAHITFFDSSNSNVTLTDWPKDMYDTAKKYYEALQKEIERTCGDLELSDEEDIGDLDLVEV